MTEHFKAPEKIQLSEEEIANLSDAQFKTLVIKTLTELLEFVRKLDEKMKPMLRETKENVQRTNSDAKETRPGNRDTKAMVCTRRAQFDCGYQSERLKSGGE